MVRVNESRTLLHSGDGCDEASVEFACGDIDDMLAYITYADHRHLATPLISTTQSLQLSHFESATQGRLYICDTSPLSAVETTSTVPSNGSSGARGPFYMLSEPISSESYSVLASTICSNRALAVLSRLVIVASLKTM